MLCDSRRCTGEKANQHRWMTHTHARTHACMHAPQSLSGNQHHRAAAVRPRELCVHRAALPCGADFQQERDETGGNTQVHPWEAKADKPAQCLLQFLAPAHRTAKNTLAIKCAHTHAAHHQAQRMLPACMAVLPACLLHKKGRTDTSIDFQVARVD